VIEPLRHAEWLVMQLVLDLHYLANHSADCADVAVAAHIRATADKLHDLAMELRALAG